MSPARFQKKLVNRWPANDAHEGVDVTRCLGPEVDVVGVLVHVERQDRGASRQCMTMVGRPLIDELAITRKPGQQHPS